MQSWHSSDTIGLSSAARPMYSLAYGGWSRQPNSLRKKWAGHGILAFSQDSSDAVKFENYRNLRQYAQSLSDSLDGQPARELAGMCRSQSVRGSDTSIGIPLHDHPRATPMVSWRILPGIGMPSSALNRLAAKNDNSGRFWKQKVLQPARCPRSGKGVCTKPWHTRQDRPDRCRNHRPLLCPPPRSGPQSSCGKAAHSQRLRLEESPVGRDAQTSSGPDPRALGEKGGRGRLIGRTKGGMSLAMCFRQVSDRSVVLRLFSMTQGPRRHIGLLVTQRRRSACKPSRGSGLSRHWRLRPLHRT